MISGKVTGLNLYFNCIECFRAITIEYFPIYVGAALYVLLHSFLHTWVFVALQVLTTSLHALTDLPFPLKFFLGGLLLFF